MKLIAGACGILATMALVTAQQPQAEYRLDAAAFVRAPLAPWSGSVNYRAPSLPYLPGQQPHSKSIGVRLTWGEKHEFEWGEPFTYDVVIENTGSEAVRVPWSPDPNAFVASDRLRSMLFIIEAFQPDGSSKLGNLEGPHCGVPTRFQAV